MQNTLRAGDTAGQPLFWGRRFREFRSLYDSALLDEAGRLTAMAGERRAAIRMLDILAALPEADFIRLEEHQ